MAIMAMLGAAASSGYQALVRGMTERGVTASASSALRAAKERAHVDRRHTAVFCYNRLLRAANTAADINGVAVGVIVAVHRVGRLSAVSGKFLYDEFADLESTYETEAETSELGKRKGMRLYRINNSRVSQMEYSVVADATYLDTESLAYLPSEGRMTNVWMGAFYNLSKSDHEPSSWKAGDGYGLEFLEMQLPEGYVFDGQIPSDVGSISVVKVIDFDPEQDQTETVDVWSVKPDESGTPKRWKKAGSASSDDSSV